jgi:hypothetical protein
MTCGAISESSAVLDAETWQMASGRRGLWTRSIQLNLQDGLAARLSSETEA